MDDRAFEAVLRRHLKFLPAGAPLPDEAALPELGLDSMQAVELLFDLEDEIGVTLPDGAMVAETFATVASLRRAVTAAAPPAGVA
jgi:acyl carrier protein